MRCSNVGRSDCGLHRAAVGPIELASISIGESFEGIDRSFMQAAVRAGMFVASFAHPKKGCLLFVNLLCSPQAGLTTEQHPCQHSGPEGGVLGVWGLQS